MKLSEAFSLIRNGASIKQYDNALGLPITRIETISNKVIDRDKCGYADIFEVDKYQDYVLQDGDILMSHINSVQHLGKTALYKKVDDEVLIHGMNLLMLRPKQELIVPDYAYIALNSSKFLRQLPKITKQSVNQASFTVSNLKELEIDIPPISRQRKIASHIATIEKLIFNRQQALFVLDNLAQSRFIEMFGDPITNPMNWNINPVIEYCDCMVPGRDKPKSFTGNTPWITIDDLIPMGITLQSKSGIGLSDNEIELVKRKKIPINSVVMSCVGNLGICSIAGKEMIINQQLHAFQCKSKMNPYYLMYSLTAQKKHMELQASKTTVLYMNKTVCNSIPIMETPIELQNQFADFVVLTSKSKLAVQQSIDTLQTLKDKLMQDYFG